MLEAALREAHEYIANGWQPHPNVIARIDAALAQPTKPAETPEREAMLKAVVLDLLEAFRSGEPDDEAKAVAKAHAALAQPTKPAETDVERIFRTVPTKPMGPIGASAMPAAYRGKR